jgi:predicted nuclease of restriction endonuclease-like (RecB) superfamily
MAKRKQPNLSRAHTLTPTALLDDIRRLIVDTRTQVAVAINAGLTLLYWEIGARIRKDILQEKRAEYGEEVVTALARQLEVEFGRGFSRSNLFSMVRFAEVFPDLEIVQALTGQLSWTHFTKIIYLNDQLKRDFYAEMCRIERWSTRTLEKKIQSMLFERTALSKKPATLAEMELKQLREDDLVTPDLVFRDPYLLDFLGLKDTYAEKDLEAAILREMESFLLEMGVGFAFLERQKRISLDGDDYYMDLLFYHRRLRRLVAVELKIGDFKPADAGQMRLYLRWLDRYERQAGEEAPVGLILCAGKKEETIQLLDLDKDSIRVSSYWTNVLPKQELERKLHEAVRLARTRVNQLRSLVAESPTTSEAAPTNSVTTDDTIAPAEASLQSRGPRRRTLSSRRMKRKGA